MPVSFRKISKVTPLPAVGTERVSIDHISESVEDLAAARSAIAAFKELESEALAKIRAALGSATVGTIAGEDAVRAEERTNTSLDRDSVKLLLGEAYGSVLRMTPYVAVTLVGKFRN